MLVLASNIVLSAAEQAVPGTPLVGWHNLVRADNISATSALVAAPAVNVANPSTILKWTAAAIGQQYLEMSIDSLDDIDYLAVARHNFGTAGIAVSVEGYDELVGSPAEPDWVELVEPVFVADDSPILFRWTTPPLLGVRLRMQTGSAPATAAVLYIGTLLVMPRGVTTSDQFSPFNFGRQTTVITGRSEAGDFLGRITTGSTVDSQQSFAHLNPAWYRTYFQPFADAAVDQPFFYAWSPLDYPDEVGFASMTADIRPTVDPVTRRMAVQLQMGGILK